MPKVFSFAVLKSGIEPADYEEWVRQVDYAAGREIPSITNYRVYRVNGSGIGQSLGPYLCDYVEVIDVTSMEEYFADIREHPAVRPIIEQIGDYISSIGTAWGVPVDD